MMLQRKPTVAAALPVYGDLCWPENKSGDFYTAGRPLHNDNECLNP